jgi:hypothetical protein
MGRTQHFVLENAVFLDFVSGNAIEEAFRESIKMGFFSQSDIGFLDSP